MRSRALTSLAVWVVAGSVVAGASCGHGATVSAAAAPETATEPATPDDRAAGAADTEAPAVTASPDDAVDCRAVLAGKRVDDGLPTLEQRNASGAADAARAHAGWARQRGEAADQGARLRDPARTPPLPVTPDASEVVRMVRALGASGCEGKPLPALTLVVVEVSPAGEVSRVWVSRVDDATAACVSRRIEPLRLPPSRCGARLRLWVPRRAPAGPSDQVGAVSLVGSRCSRPCLRSR